MPGMFGIIFTSAMTGKMRLAENIFLLIDLQCKVELTL